jgi:hypothetical protein
MHSTSTPIPIRTAATGAETYQEEHAEPDPAEQTHSGAAPARKDRAQPSRAEQPPPRDLTSGMWLCPCSSPIVVVAMVMVMVMRCSVSARNWLKNAGAHPRSQPGDGAQDGK